MGTGFTRWIAAHLAALAAAPLAAALLLGTARLLAAMGDAAGARALDYAALACGGVWAAALTALVAILAGERLWAHRAGRIEARDTETRDPETRDSD